MGFIEDIFSSGPKEGAMQSAINSTQRRRRKELLGQFNESIEIDAISRGEISNLFDTNAGNDVIAARLKEAVEGKGLFGIRRRNQALREQRAQSPGISQLLA